jgi:hypothetical protein
MLRCSSCRDHPDATRATMGAADLCLACGRFHHEPESAGPGLCASCVDDVTERVLAPMGRDGRQVAVCLPCLDEHPRQGRYRFEGGRPKGGAQSITISGSRGVGEGNRRVGTTRA